MTPRIGSLCSGVGGLDLAAEAATGGRLAWWSDPAPGPRAVMAARWPDANPVGDLTRLDWAAVPPIDVLTAGYPCQPFSLAGARKGTHDPRHLWPHIADAVRVLRPALVILENVPGHLTLGFNHVIRDLTAVGYDLQWSLVRASDVGPPTRRERLYVAAYPGRTPWEGPTHPPRPAPPHSPRRSPPSPASHFEWGPYADAVHHWDRIHGPHPHPIAASHGAPVIAPRFVEWLMAFPPGWVTDLLAPVPALHALGNAVVPPQAHHAIHGLITRAAGRRGRAAVGAP